jgi:hypothetical protein
MRVILSRKGFDSQYGGYPSPILPDGRLVSLPIPNENDTFSYNQLRLDSYRTYYDLMIELGMMVSCQTCHLDPDICREVIPRDRNWLPLFGQINAAERHLEKQRVGIGDLFLFFGWFKQTEFQNGKISFSQNAPDLHVIFGYLQISQVLRANSLNDFNDWMLYHPHIKLRNRRENKTNTIYVARDRLQFNLKLPGAGVLHFSKRLVLTKNGYSRSRWDLDPEIFKKTEISYHPNPWKEDYFQSANKGQEFVIKENEKIENWAKELIEKNYKSC